MSPAFPQRNKLRLAFFCAAALAQALAPKIPAFDSSHLIYPRYEQSISNHSDIYTTQTEPDSRRNPPPGLGTKNTMLREDSDHVPLDVPELIDSAGLRWDALHFQAVALRGSYAFEHQYAFSPGVPIILRLVYFGKQQLFDLIRLSHIDEYISPLILNVFTAILKAVLTGLLASEPCIELYSLTASISYSHEYAYLVLIIFIMMGAPPVVLRNAYAEPFFAYFSFRGMRFYHQQSYLTAALCFALATCFRSNGIILVGFIIYDLVVRPILNHYVSISGCGISRTSLDTAKVVLGSFRKMRAKAVIYSMFLSAIVVAPFLAHQYLAYAAFCRGTEDFNDNITYPRPWCLSRIPLVYSFVQAHYWDVGFLRYWTIAQIPNFLLAMPMLALTSCSGFTFLRLAYRGLTTTARSTTHSQPRDIISSPTPSVTLTLLPYVIHALVLSTLLFTTAHVQIALRVLPTATPWASWAGAALVMAGTRQDNAKPPDSVTRSSKGRKRNPPCPRSWTVFASHMWIRWSVIWAFVSSILWLSFLPPA
ncbi:glycosyltransferase family 76 protein [Ceratobasidium sp. AG-Ba]|nr:glycosyltransferase family 76 protein [Ceratobasidium sp. AG-Ba]